MPGGAGWRWVQPEGWSAPPAGFIPPPGWQPDPSWPPAPPDHDYWRRTRFGRWRRRLGLGLAVIMALTLFGGCAASLVFGPCAFDPPPGDVGDVTVTNDTPRPVAIALCSNDSCSHAFEPETTAAFRDASVQVELCSGPVITISDPNTHVLLGCVTAPTEDRDSNVSPVAVSQMTSKACSHTKPPARLIYDP